MEKVIIATESLITVRSCYPQGYWERQIRVFFTVHQEKQQLASGMRAIGQDPPFQEK